MGVSGRFRIEERFFRNTTSDGQALTDGHHFRLRSRYRIQLLFPIDKSERWFVRASDEIMFHSDEDDPWSFDQNRVYASLEYAFSRPLSVEIGYLFLTANSRGTIQNVNNLRLTLYHRIFLREE